MPRDDRPRDETSRHPETAGAAERPAESTLRWPSAVVAVGLTIASLLAALAAGATLWGPEARPSNAEASRRSAEPSGEPPAGSAPVVVELFTSQGCSSCPPADRLLSELAQREGIVALAYHVDYWNRLGWTDPFSDAAYSARQRRYARALGSRVYTPQLVIDGVEHVVGSKRGAVEAAIARASTNPKAFELDVALEREEGATTSLAVRAIAQPGAGAPPVASYLAVVVEDGRVTEVESGENARETLRDDRVVRHVEALGPVRVGETVRWRFAVDPSWDAETVSVVVLAQADDGLRIVGAASRRLIDSAI